MLETMKKHGKKLLVLADEVVDNQYAREFSSVFQILIRDKLPIFLLMTGLYENIDDLQKDKSLVSAIAESKTYSIKDIRERLGLASNEFGPYKKRLIRKGILSDEKGLARLALPLFDEFVRENYY